MFGRLQAMRDPAVVRAAAFTAVLIGFEAFAVPPGYGSYFLASPDHPSRLLGLAALLVALAQAVTFLHVWASLLAGTTVRCVFFVVFAGAVFIQYGYYEAMHGFATSDDLIVAAWGVSPETRKAMARAYLAWYALLPVLAYGVLLWMTPVRHPASRAWLAAAAAAVLLASGLSIGLRLNAVSHYQGYPTTSVGGFYQSLAGVAWRWTRYPREELPALAQTDPPSNNIVLLVDESVRADHLSLNGYARATTPTLEELDRRGLLTNWGTAVAGSNCSAAANLLLWVGVPPERLPDTRQELRRWPSILQYAKGMGYRTIVMNGQVARHSIGDALDTRLIDEWVPPGEVAHPEAIDFTLAQRIRQVVGGSRGNFVWVNKRGVHWPYPNAYPPDRVRWTPSAPGDVQLWQRPDRIARDELINAYDNAIRYNVDGFFRELDIGSLPPGTVFIYTSDHGQSLIEHGEPWLHCNDRRSGRQSRHAEVSVPLIMAITGQPGVDVRHARDRARHANVFATLLDLMGVPPGARLHQQQHWPSLWPPERFAFRRRSYFLGNSVLGVTPFGDRVDFDEPPGDD